MNQGKTKVKELENQPSIADYVNSPKNQCPVHSRSRSASVKRKKPPSLQVHGIISENKTYIKENCLAEEEPTVSHGPKRAEPDELKQHENDARDNLITGLDSSIVKALELLLTPIREDIINLQSEVHAEFRENAKLHEENLQLFKQVQNVWEKNKDLIKRVVELETKMLEASVLLCGIQESPWETEEDRCEKIYIALSNTLLGRSKEERLNLARGMLIKCTKQIGTYRLI